MRKKLDGPMNNNSHYMKCGGKNFMTFSVHQNFWFQYTKSSKTPSCPTCNHLVVVLLLAHTYNNICPLQIFNKMATKYKPLKDKTKQKTKATQLIHEHNSSVFVYEHNHSAFFQRNKNFIDQETISKEASSHTKDLNIFSIEPHQTCKSLICQACLAKI